MNSSAQIEYIFPTLEGDVIYTGKLILTNNEDQDKANDIFSEIEKIADDKKLAEFNRLVQIGVLREIEKTGSKVVYAVLD